MCSAALIIELQVKVMYAGRETQRRVDVYIYYFLNSALDGVGGQHDDPAAFPRESPCTH